MVRTLWGRGDIHGPFHSGRSPCHFHTGWNRSNVRMEIHFLYGCGGHSLDHIILVTRTASRGELAADQRNYGTIFNPHDRLFIRYDHVVYHLEEKEPTASRHSQKGGAFP